MRGILGFVPLFLISLLFSDYRLCTARVLTGAALASLEEKLGFHVHGPVDCRRRDLENVVRHDEQHHRDAV
jgi:hypothetical protein